MISIIFCSNRVNPKFNEWFLPSLANQLSEEDKGNIEVLHINTNDSVFVRYDNVIQFQYEYNGIKVRQSKPKPNIYQGPNRKTKTEMFSPSNARNTGIILSEGDYLVFADDVAVLMPTWWGAVKEAAARKMIVCGAYQKHFNMVVENGIYLNPEKGYHQMGRDSRWLQGSDQGPVQISGQALFGCSLGIPAKDILEVNGFDELCDSIGGEDYHLGIRLNNAGKRVHYDRRMLTIESEELHDPEKNPHRMLRDDRLLTDAEYNARLRDFGVTKRKAPGRPDSSHMILDLLLGKHQVQTLGNNYSIAADRPSKYFFPPADHDYHWFDKKPLSEI